MHASFIKQYTHILTLHFWEIRVILKTLGHAYHLYPQQYPINIMSSARLCSVIQNAELHVSSNRATSFLPNFPLSSLEHTFHKNSLL